MKKILYFFSFVALFSCSSENEEDKHNDEPNGQLSYQVDIAPIIQSNCMVCHNAQSASGGLVIDGETSMVAMAQSGLLEEVLLLPPNNPRKMPPGFNLSSADLNRLLAWIAQVNE
jgi:hypothetical protein